MKESLAGLLVVLLSSVPGESANLVKNGGMEEVGDKGIPSGWRPVRAFLPARVVDEQPHRGSRCGRIEGAGRQVAWRQEVRPAEGRIYTGTGWFRARGLHLDKSAHGFARFYFHILYKNRPYSGTSHFYRDLPEGSYDWQRFSVRLVPRDDLQVEKIWVTVTGKLSGGTLDFDDIELRPALSRGGFVAAEWSLSRQARYISDMGTAVPSSALSTRAEHGKWKLFDYEVGSLKGRMVWASGEAAAPELSLPLNAKGWHAIFLGLAAPSGLAHQALVRLSRDSAYTLRHRTAGQIEEVFFKVADLTDQSLYLAQQCESVGRATGLAYVRLVPLTKEERVAIKSEKADLSHRRLVASIDGFSFIYSRRPTSRRALLQETEAYRDTDFGTLILQMGGAVMVNYPSKIGEMIGQELDDFPRPGDRQYVEALKELARKGINPTRVLIEGAHDAGMKVHVALRPGAWVHTEPFTDFYNSRFYAQHPEWHCLDLQGHETGRMSLAALPVRTRLIDVLREAVRMGADGACVLFVRGVPFTLYGKPFRDLFQARHREDPGKLKEDDPRVLKLRADCLTQFMREIRQMLDEEASRREGARLSLSAFVLPSEADNLRFGMDVRAWAGLGLVDLVCPMRAGGSRARECEIDFFRKACAPHGVQIKPAFISWQLSALDHVAQQAAELYRKGAGGITFWDANSVAGRNSPWSLISRMGHVTELDERAFENPPRAVTRRFHRVGGLIVDGPLSPNWGF